MPGHGLTETERRAWREDGFFVREAVFAEPELEPLREAAEIAVERAEAATAAGRDYRIDGNRYVDAARETIQFEHDARAATIRVIEPFHHLHPRFDDLLDDARIVEPMCELVGTEGVAIWTDKINLKRPLEGSGFRWHQDSPYWRHVCEHCDQLPNVMITLDDADRQNGCFRLVPGSHRKGFLPGLNDGTRLGPLFTDPASFDEEAQWLAEVPAGSLVVFDSHMVHGSEPNLSDRSRRAIVLTYQPADHPMFKFSGIRNFSISESTAEGDRAGAAGRV